MAAPYDPSRPLATIPAFDGLRAVAVVLVVLFHAGRLPGGFLGVDLFFVLSGFLITTLLLDEHAHRGSIDLRSFWARRARRLVPALLLFLVITLVAVALLFDLDAAGANGSEALASATYVSNWWTLHAPAPYLTVFQHTWSLAIEAQFYAIWPVVIVLALRCAAPADRPRAATIVLAISGLGAITSAALMIVLYTGPASLARVSFGTDTRAAPILFGAALAAGLHRRSAPVGAGRRRIVEAGAAAGLGVLVALTLVVDRPEPTLYDGAFAVVICPLLTLVVGGVALADGPLARVLSVAPLRALGLISYGVYLWHWPVLFLMNADRLHLRDGWLLAAQVALTLALASASYRFVELPIRQRRRPFTPRPPVDARRP